MDIKILEMEDTKCRFVLKNASPAKANALRRTMLTDIPKMAIDSVDFHLGPIDVDGREFESITPLFDEIIAHRLGMVPVPTRPDGFEFNYKDDCVCGGEGCANCSVMYSLNRNGPCTVLSGDLMPVMGGSGVSNESLKPCDLNIPIVELADRQSVMIYAHAVKGTARKHVKWQVANGVGYKYMPRIEIGNVSDPEDVKSACPKNVFDISKGKLTVRKGGELDCILCNACSEKDPEVKVTGDDTEFVFTFETDGSLTAQQVLDEAVKILSESAKDLGEKIVALASQ